MTETDRVMMLIRNALEDDAALRQMGELSYCELVIDSLETACEGYQARLEELRAEAEDEG